jgi:hypothetical protein
MAQGARQDSVIGSQSVKTPQSMPTVDQILDRYVEAIGGAAALRKLTSRVVKMALVIEVSDVTVSYEGYRQAPNKEVEIFKVKLGNGFEYEVSRGPSSRYYKIEEMNLAKLSSVRAADILLISAHGWVQFANTDSMKMGEERLRPERLSHLSPSLIYFDSCNLGVSAHFIQSFRDRGAQFYVAPILANEAGNSSTKTIAYFFERLKAGDTPSKALFYTRKKLYELYGEKEGFNMLLYRAFPFRVYSLN